MSRLLSPRVLGAVALVILALVVGRVLVPVPLPGIQLPAEPIHIGPFSIPNTLIATILADITVLAFVFAATRNLSLVPSGLQNLMEWLIEAWYNLCEDIAGENARRFFPWVMTIFLLVLVANWWELIPGFDAIGWLESHTVPGAAAANSPGGEEILDEEVLRHYRVVELLPGAVHTIVADEYRPTAHEYEEAHEEHVLPHNEEGEEVAVLVPFLRAAATDLSFTFALALISMFMVQVYGIQALGLGYFSRFINLKGGVIGFVVGIFEIISEFGKIISFAFRLFGNIFGGQVLLFVMAFLIPWLLPVPFYGLEVFVGGIQAFVFAILTLVFFAGAVVSHDDHH